MDSNRNETERTGSQRYKGNSSSGRTPDTSADRSNCSPADSTKYDPGTSILPPAPKASRNRHIAPDHTPPKHGNCSSRKHHRHPKAGMADNQPKETNCHSREGNDTGKDSSCTLSDPSLKSHRQCTTDSVLVSGGSSTRKTQSSSGHCPRDQKGPLCHSGTGSHKNPVAIIQ